MAKKGVKRIGLAPGMKYFKDRSGGNIVTVPADQATQFVVAEWFEGTAEKEKQADLFWIRQSADRQIDYFKEKRGKAKPYSFVIAKKYAGLHRFYVEASLTGYKDRELTGLFVQAYCPPRVVSSYWREHKEGNNQQIHSGNPTIYNTALHLHVELEGLNGHTCTIEIYNCEINLLRSTDDQKISKVYRRTVVNGAIDLYIPGADTLAWRKDMGLEKPIERFYMMLRVDGQRDYIIDTTKNKDVRHAIHLYIKNEIGKFIAPVIQRSNKVITVGDEPKVPQRVDFCKFTAIAVQDRDKAVVLFDEKKPSTFQLAEKQFRFSFDMFYETDQYEVPDRSKSLLNNLVKFLIANPHIKAHVESYADIRNTHAYNQQLTDRRADRLLSYLYTNGVKNALERFSYGETRAKQFDYITNEDRPIHQINRKTSIIFFLNDLKKIFYNSIVPNVEQPVNMVIDVRNYTTERCLMDKTKHKNTEVTYLEVVNVNAGRDVVKKLPVNGGKVNLSVFSSEGGMFPTQIGLTPNRFELRINSCSYFPDSRKTSIVVNAFTDAVWILHATYDFEQDYPMDCRGVSVSTPIVRGIAELLERAQKFIDKYLSVLRYFPIGNLYLTVLELVMDYVASEANMYGIGYGKKWNFAGGKFNKETSYVEHNKDLVEKGILTLTLLVMIVELIIAILTLGRSAATKLPKVKKLIKGIDKVNAAKKQVTDLGFDFIFPKVAFTYGSYLEKVNNIVHFVTRYNIKADPVIGIKFDKKLSLKDVVNEAIMQRNPDIKEALKNEEINREDPLLENMDKYGANKARGYAKGEIGKGLQALLDYAGVDAKIRILFSGEIKQEYQLKVSAPANYEQYSGTVSVTNKLVSGFNNSAGKSLGASSIKMEAQLEVKGRMHFVGIVPIDPFSAATFLGGVSRQVDSSLAIGLRSHFNHTRVWSAGDRQGLYYQDTIYFSGVKGEVSFQASDRSEGEVYDDSKTALEFKFNLFGEHTFEMPKIQLI